MECSSFQVIQRELPTSFYAQNECLFSDIYELFTQTEREIEAKNNLQWSHFKKQRDAFVKYRQDNDIKLSKHESEMLEAMSNVRKQKEELKLQLSNIEVKILNWQTQISSAQEVVKQRKHYLSSLKTEMDKRTISLNKTYKAFQIAIAYYEKYLDVTLTVTDNHLILLNLAGKTVQFVYEKDGFYVQPDNLCLATPRELLLYLCKLKF